MHPWYLLLVALLASVLTGPSPALAASPSFDCTKAQSSAEKAVCGSETLAALDREMARLFELAANGPHRTPESLKHLKAYQRGWIKGRDDCWKSDAGLEQCVANEYVLRIHDLREAYADARASASITGASNARDSSNLSLGPVAYACKGLGAGLSAVFVNTAPGRYASLKWQSNAVVLAQESAASGARYTGSNYAGAFAFWSKGQDATFVRPGQSALTCTVDDTG